MIEKTRLETEFWKAGAPKTKAAIMQKRQLEQALDHSN